MGNMISNYVERMKAAFVPQVDNQARMAMDGTVCVRTNTANGKEWLGFKNGEAIAYACSCHGTDSCIHTWGIAARRQNANSLNLAHSLMCFKLLISAAKIQKNERRAK